MPPTLLPDDEEDYVSGEDSDFAPDATPTARSESDESETEVAKESDKQKSKPKKRRPEEQEAEDAGFENSGDEAIIEKGLKKRRKKTKQGKGEEDEDEGGEGGLIKTRRQRALEKEEKKIVTDVTVPTVDIDAIWARMKAGAPPPAPTAPVQPSETQEQERVDGQKSTEPDAAQNGSSLNDDPNAMILIKRTYTFAGKTQTEEKLVPRNSAEAKLYLSTQSDPSKPVPTDIPIPDPAVPTKPPPRKAFRSRFEPVVDLPVRTDLKFGVRARAQEPVRKWETVEDKGKKLNTVEKSALDWAGYVDKEGIGDELAQAGKAKGAFKERQQFLARVEGKREVEERRARGLPV